ncbi:MAG TPA: sugar ABC transporter permease [Trueperaceae bacterium]
MRLTRDRLTAILMILPSLVLLGVFVYGFIGRTAYVSLTDWGQNPAQALALNPVISFIGLENYQSLFTSALDSRFRQDLVNTFFFTLFFLLGCLAIGLTLAILLDRRVKGEGFFRTVFLFPMALAFIVTGTIWRWMLQPQGGVNVLPTLIGLPRLQFRWLTSREQVWQFNWQNLPVILGVGVGVILLWLTVLSFRRGRRGRGTVMAVLTAVAAIWTATGARSVEILSYPEPHGFNLALVGIIIAAVWQMSGYTMALYLAGLRGISDDLREAARVDGASELQLFRHVIFPLLGPISLSAVIILGHISLKIFDLIFAMAGPDNIRTSVPALSMYLRAFRANQFAEGAAIAVVLLLMVGAVIIPYLWTQLRGEVRR